MTLVMFPSKNSKYADYASSATFTKSAKIMFVFPNDARNYASPIYKCLRWSSTVIYGWPSHSWNDLIFLLLVPVLL